MSLAGCQIIPNDVNFRLQKCLEFFDKNSADKIQSKNYIMPIRVKLESRKKHIAYYLDYHSMFKQNFHSFEDVEAEKGRCVKTKEFGSANVFFFQYLFF